MKQRFLLQILLLAQHVSDTTMPIISWGLYVRVAGCCSILQTGHITFSSTPDQQLENHSTKYHTLQPLYNTLELLMMSIVVPETCWASNKICYEKPLLYVVGTLFPHINDDARSKSHQMYKDYIHDLKYLTNEKKIHVIFLYFMFPSCYLLHLFLCHMLPCSSSWPRHLRVW